MSVRAAKTTTSVQKRLGHSSAEMTPNISTGATVSRSISPRHPGFESPSPAPGVKSLGQDLGLGFQLSASIEIDK
jgi:hypothetical protein